MKRLLFLFLFGIPLLLGQNNVQVAPDCFFFVTYTVVANAVTNVNGQATANGRWPQLGYNNGNNGCVAWTVTYYDSNGAALTALSLELDSAPDNAGAAGTWAPFVGSIVSGVNPNIAVTNAFTTVTGYNKWISLDLSGLTGSGTVQAYAYGCRSLTCAPLVTATGGGGITVDITQVGGVAVPDGSLPVLSGCASQATVPLSGTGYTQIVAGSGTKVIHVCNLVWGSGAANAPVVNTFSLAFGVCAGSPTQALALPGVTGYTDYFGGSLAGAAGAALCASEAVANSDVVTVTYSLF